MGKALITALGAVLLVGFGCQHDDKDSMKHDNMRSGSEMRSSDGMRSSSSSSSMSTDTSMSAGKDDCPHCPGVQHADAEGRCPVCHMKVAQNESR